MNQVNPNDPMVRLAKTEKQVFLLTQSYNALVSEVGTLKARVKTLEVECGLVSEGGEAVEDVDE